MNATMLAERALVKQDWPLIEREGLTLTLSPLLQAVNTLTHAFTTRMGGTSAVPLDSFNLGRHWPTEESRQDAMANRMKLCNALGLEAHKLTVPSQQHTSNIHIATNDQPFGQALPNLDGVATCERQLPVLLHFADCVPVMIYDTNKQVLCVMHAGWRGTAGGIVSKGVQLLKEYFGCNPAHIKAAVGPAIGSCCYETGDEVVQGLASTVSNIEPFVRTHNGKPHPDLKAVNAMQLFEAGVNDVDVSAWCTACKPEIFYSHRQSGGKTGRQGAIACIR